MTIHVSGRLVPLAVLAALSATQPACAQASRPAYLVTTTCAALEGSTIPIPDQMPEQRRTITASLDQRARLVGADLGFSQDRVEADIGRRRNDILARLHDSDPDKSKRSPHQMTQLTQVCPGLLGSRGFDVISQMP